MVQSLRIFAVVAVMIFAAVGCQKKGTESAAKGEAESSATLSNADSTGSTGGETQAEAEKSSTEAGTSSAASTAEGSKGGSQVHAKSSTLTEVDDGDVVDLRVGQVLTVVLDSNHAAGLSWTMAKPTTTVIVPEGKPIYALKSAKAATDESPGTETWHFRAAKPGEQTVRLEYQRGMGQSVTERRFGFTATVR